MQNDKCNISIIYDNTTTKTEEKQNKFLNFWEWLQKLDWSNYFRLASMTI